MDIQLKKEQTQRALSSLEELVSKYSENQTDVILRDALIQRFEYSTEAFWKYLKAYLQTEHNLSANSPREVIRTGLTAKLYSEETSQELLQMLMTVTLPVIPMSKNLQNPLPIVSQTIPKI